MNWTKTDEAIASSASVVATVMRLYSKWKTNASRLNLKLANQEPVFMIVSTFFFLTCPTEWSSNFIIPFASIENT